MSAYQRRARLPAHSLATPPRIGSRSRRRATEQPEGQSDLRVAETEGAVKVRLRERPGAVSDEPDQCRADEDVHERRVAEQLAHDVAERRRGGGSNLPANIGLDNVSIRVLTF